MDSLAGCANNPRPWALLDMNLHEVQRPEKMLWEATPWLELVLYSKLTEEDLANSHAGSDKFAEEPSLCQTRPDSTRDVFWMSHEAYCTCVGSMISRNMSTRAKNLN